MKMLSTDRRRNEIVLSVPRMPAAIKTFLITLILSVFIDCRKGQFYVEATNLSSPSNTIFSLSTIDRHIRPTKARRDETVADEIHPQALQIANEVQLPITSIQLHSGGVDTSDKRILANKKETSKIDAAESVDKSRKNPPAASSNAADETLLADVSSGVELDENKGNKLDDQSKGTSKKGTIDANVEEKKSGKVPTIDDENIATKSDDDTTEAKRDEGTNDDYGKDDDFEKNDDGDDDDKTSGDVSSGAKTTEGEESEPNINDDDRNENDLEKTEPSIVDEDKEDRSTVPPGALIMVFFVAAFMVRKKLIDNSIIRGQYGGNYSRSDSSHNSDEFTYGVSTVMSGKNARYGNDSNLSRHFNRETVPLSSATDDEWGWEDGSTEGDIELGGADAAKDEDDLQMALALSLSEQTSKKSSSASSLIPEKPSGSRKSPVIEPSSYRSSPVHPGIKTKLEDQDSWDDDSGWDDAPASAPDSVSTTIPANDIEALIAETRASHVPEGSYISSLGKKTTNSSQNTKNTVATKAREEDDIFASIGLSVAPKQLISQNVSGAPEGRINSIQRPAQTSSPVGWRNTVTATNELNSSSIPSATRVELENSENGSEWDDDSDLDDLLDD